MFDETEGKSGYILFAKDVTERIRSEERLLQLERAVESAPNGIMITTNKGEITWVNPQYTELTGYTLDEVIGKNPRILKSGKHARAFYKH